MMKENKKSKEIQADFNSEIRLFKEELESAVRAFAGVANNEERKILELDDARIVPASLEKWAVNFNFMRLEPDISHRSPIPTIWIAEVDPGEDKNKKQEQQYLLKKLEVRTTRIDYTTNPENNPRDGFYKWKTEEPGPYTTI